MKKILTSTYYWLALAAFEIVILLNLTIYSYSIDMFANFILLIVFFALPLIAFKIYCQDRRQIFYHQKSKK